MSARHRNRDFLSEELPIRRSAGFQTCCAADFQVGITARRPAGLETRDTADLEVCATLKSSHDAGFSLMEVMIALLVMGVALVALTRGMTTALGSTKESEVQTIVVSLAAGQIKTLRASALLLDETTEGDFGENFPKYKWEQTVSASDVDGLHQVDVVVQDAKSGASLYKLSTLLFDSDYPSSSAADAKQKQKDLEKAKNKKGRAR